MELKIQNQKAAKAIRIVAWVAALAVMWQAVRFCQGKIGAPILDQMMEAMQTLGSTALGTPNGVGQAAGETGGLFASIGGMLFKGMYYVAGVGIWVLLGSMVNALGETVARIVEVGFDQYMREVRAAQEVARQDAELADARFRRAQRREKRKAQQAKGLSVGSIAIGVFLGWILF